MSNISSSQFISTFDSEFEHNATVAQSLERASAGSDGTPSEVSTLTPSASGSQITWYNRSSQRRSWIWLHAINWLKYLNCLPHPGQW